MSVKNFLFVLFFAGCAVRILIFIAGHIKSGPEFYLNYGDAGGYTILAKNLVAGNGFSWEKEPPFLPNGNRTPGYPMFLAVSYAFSGSFYPIIFIQIMLGAVIPILGYKILKELDFSEPVSRIAGIFLAVEPFFAAHSVFLLTEIIFISLLLCFLLIIIPYLKDEGYRWAPAVAGFLIGIVSLVRPIGLYLVPIFALFLLFWGKKKLRQRLAGAVIFIAVGAAAVFPWLWRNYNQFGFMRLTYVDAKNLYFNYAGGTLAMANGTTLDLEQEKLMVKIDDAGLDSRDPALPDFFRKEAKKIIFAHLPAFLELNALTAWQFFTHDAYYDLAVHLGFYRGAGGPPISILELRRSLATIPGLFLRDPLFFIFIAGRMFWIMVMLFFLGGVWLSLRDKGNRRRDLLIFVLIGYFLAASLTTGYAINARLRLPILLFYAVYAAIGARAIYSRILIKKFDKLDS
ncbi:MAG: glycosyltransferase family 39 protein [Candidatus Sungbacteria bacterium]|nr:glycosyltransferase family 39 protein [Candidatus Sungbacteria bacterium]